MWHYRYAVSLVYISATTQGTKTTTLASTDLMCSEGGLAL